MDKRFKNDVEMDRLPQLVKQQLENDDIVLSGNDSD